MTRLYPGCAKRLVDVSCALAALPVLLLVGVVVAVAIKLDDRGPILFRQQRVGRSGVPFELLKFRTMAVGSANVPSRSADALQVTRVGRLLRRTNIDELPQLLNVLAGDMSLVGPRPALRSQTELLAQRKANAAWNCKPGLTGLAQVNAYDGMPEQEKAAWDGRYAQSLSPLGDLSIIARTFLYLARRPPVY